MQTTRSSGLHFLCLAVMAAAGCAAPPLGVSDAETRLSAAACETVELRAIFERPEEHFGRCLRFRGPIVINYHEDVAFVSSDPEKRFDIVISSAVSMSEAARRGWHEGMIAEATGVL